MTADTTVQSGMALHRFQANKVVTQALRSKHPWIYRRQCSSALTALPVGALVRVVGPKNEFLGIGLYDPLSIVAIRIFCFEDVVIDQQFFYDRLLKIFLNRQAQAKLQNTTAFRWVHGEADGFGGLNIDVYQNTAVAVLYLQSWQTHLADIFQSLSESLGLDHFYCRLPHGQTQSGAAEQLYDFKHKSLVSAVEPVWFSEGGVEYPSFVLTGQKSGFYLDLREVRQCLHNLDLTNKRVLNLFASSGGLSGLAEKCGASTVISVEASPKCAQQFLFLQEAWHLDANKQTWLTTDVWEYLKTEAFKSSEQFDVIILDPPALAKSTTAEQDLQRVWSGLVKKILPKLRRGGHLLTICCTDRISEIEHGLWTKEVAEDLGIHLVCVQKIKQTFDHPVHTKLKERDYFHAYQWQMK